MGGQSLVSKKKRGPAPTGKGIPIMVRIQPKLLTEIDEWMRKSPELDTRPKAIRQLVELALGVRKAKGR